MTVDWSRFVGLPYRDRGRDYDGVDCWGLVFLVYRDALGVAIPSYADDCTPPFKPRERAELVAKKTVTWRRRESGRGQVFDMVLMRSGRFVCHVGVVAPQNMVLHCEDSVGSVIEPLRSPQIASRVEGIYEYV